VGFDGYKGVIADSDVVLLATPPHFRPMHLRAAIEAGKHVFAEKPVAVDPWGVRHVLETAEMAKQRGLTIVSGLCWRYDASMQETIRRVHEGQIGNITAVESTRFSGIVGRSQDRDPSWTEMEYQLRNWYYYTWLSGDFNVEQFVHELDKVAWALGQYPTSVICAGGRQTRNGPNSGHIYDHFSAIYDYADGTRYYAATRHQNGCTNTMRDVVHGADGRAELGKFTITGKKPWRGDRAKVQMHQAEHNDMFAALRAGKIINNGEYMAKSTMMAIMARESAYTGKSITWDDIMASKLELKPTAYTRDGVPPKAEIAMPGITKFV
jgi:predicted dehydrogenase